MTAARLATIRHGEVGWLHEKPDGSIELSDAAALLNVSVSSVKRARKVLDEGAPEDIAAVESGEKVVSAAENGQKKKARSAVRLTPRRFSLKICRNNAWKEAAWPKFGPSTKVQCPLL